MSDNVVPGLDRDLKIIMDSKYNVDLENEARSFIEGTLHHSLPPGSFAHILKDGKILCQIINALEPHHITISNGHGPFNHMENIGNFLNAASGLLGIPSNELFQTVDLYEEKNIPQVIDAIFAVSRHAQKKGYNVKLIGKKLPDKHEVHFTPEQLAHTETSWQYGYTGGANQSHMVFGTVHKIDQGVEPGSSEPSMQTQGSFGGCNQSGIIYGGIHQISTYWTRIASPCSTCSRIQ